MKGKAESGRGWEDLKVRVEVGGIIVSDMFSRISSRKGVRIEYTVNIE